MKNRDDENDSAAESERESDQTDAKDDSDADDQNETKRFERSDNLRRRSEWFQKRTGGG